MLRKAITFPLLFLAFAFASGCVRIYGGLTGVRGSGVKASQTRQVDSFGRIDLRGSSDVEIRQGDERVVVVEADDNLLDLITTDVRGETLVISSRRPYSSRLGVRVQVTTPNLSAVSVSGSGDITIDGLSSPSFEISVQGSGDVAAAGEVDRLEVRIMGSGDVELFALRAREAKVSIAGSGDAELEVSEALDATIQGSGDIVYRGHPPKVTQRVHGSGDVVPR